MSGTRRCRARRCQGAVSGRARRCQASRRCRARCQARAGVRARCQARAGVRARCQTRWCRGAVSDAAVSDIARDSC
ncbi:MAG: hypothetical protein LBL06_05860 [Treponema sp.]|nr:hypothetical protein [Treponema sp.]